MCEQRDKTDGNEENERDDEGWTETEVKVKSQVISMIVVYCQRGKDMKGRCGY